MTCPEPGCGQPAGTRCTYHACPGKNLRPRSLTGVRKGDGAPPLPVPSPTHVSFDLLHAKGITA
jgi:hypothetical protein